MSSDFHRPTYTSADGQNGPTNADGLYNPTQVRLYGIPGWNPFYLRSGSVEVGDAPEGPTLKIDLRDPAKAKKDLANIEKFLDALARDPKQPILPEAKKIWRAATASSLPPYFLQLSMRLVGTVFVGAVAEGEKPGEKPEYLSSGIMFGYAYEGHTYDFPKPKIMLVPSLPLRDPANPPARPKDDSGYDKKYAEGYRVWIVDKLEQCVEIEVNQGFVEQIVLEANLPGKRSPSAYRAVMALSHRGGRLSE